jgi:hypothetical protein
MHDRCGAYTRFRPTRYDSHHTVQCQKDAGHDGMHEWQKDARTVYWAGPAVRTDETTRLRFGRWVEDH